MQRTDSVVPAVSIALVSALTAEAKQDETPGDEIPEEKMEEEMIEDAAVIDPARDTASNLVATTVGRPQKGTTKRKKYATVVRVSKRNKKDKK